MHSGSAIFSPLNTKKLLPCRWNVSVGKQRILKSLYVLPLSRKRPVVCYIQAARLCPKTVIQNAARLQRAGDRNGQLPELPRESEFPRRSLGRSRGDASRELTGRTSHAAIVRPPNSEWMKDAIPGEPYETGDAGFVRFEIRFPTLYLKRRQSPKISRAALWPGAPITPPPGCVPEPQRYKRPTGVRYCAHPGTGRRKNSWSRLISP